jgi:hypothetical protein
MTCLNRRPAPGLWLAGVLAILAAGQPAAARPDLCVPPSIPAGTSDPAGTAFFVTNAKGNVEAVDLKSGETLWESADAYRPLAVAGKRLIAQALVKDKPVAHDLVKDKPVGLHFRLVLLDLEARGKLLKQSDDLIVGGPNEYDSGGGHGGTGGSTYTFRITATLNKDEAVVKWESSFNSYRITGAAPPPGTPTSWSGSAGGSWRLDLDSGQARELTSWSRNNDPLWRQTLASPIPDRLLNPAGDGGKNPGVLRIPDNVRAALKTGNAWRNPWVIDGKGCLVLTRVKFDPKDRSRTWEATLYRWDVAGTKDADAVVLYEGPVYEGPLVGAPAAGPLQTPNGRTIILPIADKDSQRVFLFAAPEGKRLAEVALKGPASVDALDDGRTVLIWDSERLVMVSADGGKRLADLALKGGAAAVRVVNDGRRPVVISDREHVVVLSAVDGKLLADLPHKGAAPFTSLISDGRAVMIARPSEADKNVQHVVLLSTARGERLGELDVNCGKGLKIDRVAGIIGTRVYTTTAAPVLVVGNPAAAVPGAGSVGEDTVTAFDAAGGAMLWKKTYSNRVFTPPPYRGPYPPSRAK